MNTIEKLPRLLDGTLAHRTGIGAYPLCYVTADNGALCPDCARKAEAEGLTKDPDDKQWYLVDGFVPWEESVDCDHCGESVHSAY